MAWGDHHPDVQRRLVDSEPARLLMATWFEERGYAVAYKPLEVSPEAERWREFSDGGDLWVRGGVPVPDRPVRVEVKGITYPFTTAATWPFRGRGKEAYIAYQKSTWDRMHEKAWRVYSVNPAFTHVAWVSGATFSTWDAFLVYDKLLEQETLCYFCPLELVHWAPIPEDVRDAWRRKSAAPVGRSNRGTRTGGR